MEASATVTTVPTELTKEAYGPPGDSSRHLPLAALEDGLRALPRLPSDTGRLALMVRRRPDGARELLERVRLSLEEAVPGDGWARRPPRDPEAQLAVMRRDVAELIANGQPLDLFGDNLFVDFDISARNLPAGTRLRVGEATVEVTAKPHNGCAKFHARFGADALRFVAAKPTRDHNLRGIYWRVVEAGEIFVGAPIRVLSRP
jgi:hypothetical protein